MLTDISEIQPVDDSSAGVRVDEEQITDDPTVPDPTPDISNKVIYNMGFGAFVEDALNNNTKNGSFAHSIETSENAEDKPKLYFFRSCNSTIFISKHSFENLNDLKSNPNEQNIDFYKSLYNPYNHLEEVDLETSKTLALMRAFFVGHYENGAKKDLPPYVKIAYKDNTYDVEIPPKTDPTQKYIYLEIDRNDSSNDRKIVYRRFEVLQDKQGNVTGVKNAGFGVAKPGNDKVEVYEVDKFEVFKGENNINFLNKDIKFNFHLLKDYEPNKFESVNKKISFENTKMGLFDSEKSGCSNLLFGPVKDKKERDCLHIKDVKDFCDFHMMVGKPGDEKKINFTLNDENNEVKAKYEHDPNAEVKFSSDGHFKGSNYERISINNEEYNLDRNNVIKSIKVKFTDGDHKVYDVEIDLQNNKTTTLPVLDLKSLQRQNGAQSLSTGERFMGGYACVAESVNSKDRGRE